MLMNFITLVFSTWFLLGTTTTIVHAEGNEDLSRSGAKAAQALNIEIDFIDDVPEDIRVLFIAAKTKWESIISKGYGRKGVLKAGQYGCGKWFPESLAKKRRVFDDVLIYAQVIPYDGVGGVLADAAICRSSREKGKMMTRTGLMRFDMEDLKHWGDKTTFQIILHEMGHILGLGSRWKELGLVKSKNNKNIPYSGKHGKLGYRAIGGKVGKQPLVENMGSIGSKHVHWLEDIRNGGFDNELMTAWLDVGVTNPLSKLTAHALRDLGWSVNPQNSDVYQIPKKQNLLDTMSVKKESEKIFLGNDFIHQRMPLLCATMPKASA